MADLKIASKLYREVPIEFRALSRKADAKDEDGDEYELAVSTETEVERSDWFGDRWVEVLQHDESAVDMSRFERGAAVLVDHRGDQVGVVVPGSARIDDDRVLRASVRFSRSQRGKEVEDDVRRGIRSSVSVGYFVKDVAMVEKRENVPVWRVTRWQPAEVSIVSVPADLSAGVGRAAPAEAGVVFRGEEPGEEQMADKPKTEAAPTEREERAPAVAAQSHVQVLESRNAAVAEIMDLGEAYEVPGAEVRAAIAAGTSPADFALALAQKRKTKGQAQPSAEQIGDKMNAKERRNYSYLKAIRLGAGMHPRASEAGDEFGRIKFDGLEAEVHRELVGNLGKEQQWRGGIMVPMDLRSDDERMAAWERSLMHRTLDSKTLTKGVETVYERPGEMIELLRNTSVALRLGARMLAGLTGPVAFTKQTGGLTAYWVGENPAADVTASDVAFGLVNLVGRTLQATTAYSRQLLVQSSIDVEAMIREEFAIVHALKLDVSAFHGLGAAGEPTGIYKAPDVKVRAVGGAPDLADVVDSVVQVAESNALLGTLGWVTTPGLAGKMRQTLEFSAAGAKPIWDGTFLEGTVAGYRALASNQISKVMTGSEATGGSEHGAIFGNWRDLIFGMFNAMELIVDPYAQKKRALVEVTSFQMADHVLRHGESFCKWTGATA